MSDREELERILGHHGVLTADGWQFITEALLDDLMEWKNEDSTT